jgi:hypothetical protein
MSLLGPTPIEQVRLVETFISLLMKSAIFLALEKSDPEYLLKSA